MFFKYGKSLITRIGPSEFRCFKVLSKRCLHPMSFGPANMKRRQQRLENPVEIFLHGHRCPSATSRSPRFASYIPVPSQHRTVTSAAALSAASVQQANSNYGLFAKMADSAPVHLAENVLLSVQDMTGLPWWATIMCTTMALRTVVTLPLIVYQMHILDKVEKLQPEIQNLAKELKYEVAVYGKQHGWSEKDAKFHFRKNMKRLVTELYIRDNCHPFKAGLIMCIQIPMWIFISMALRNFSFNTSGSPTVGIAATRWSFSFLQFYEVTCSRSLGGDELVHTQLQNGGTLWFPDLTMPDSTWILPVILGSVNLLLVEMFALRTVELSRFQKYITIFLRVFSVVMIPLSASLPSGMVFYWVSSSFVGLTHNLFLRSPTVRRLFRLPRTKMDSDTPYKDLLAAFVAKYIRRK